MQSPISPQVKAHQEDHIQALQLDPHGLLIKQVIHPELLRLAAGQLLFHPVDLQEIFAVRRRGIQVASDTLVVEILLVFLLRGWRVTLELTLRSGNRGSQRQRSAQQQSMVGVESHSATATAVRFAVTSLQEHAKKRNPAVLSTQKRELRAIMGLVQSTLKGVAGEWQEKAGMAKQHVWADGRN